VESTPGAVLADEGAKMTDELKLRYTYQEMYNMVESGEAERVEKEGWDGIKIARVGDHYYQGVHDLNQWIKYYILMPEHQLENES
jgi:hypothetical protein